MGVSSKFIAPSVNRYVLVLFGIEVEYNKKTNQPADDQRRYYR
jgi:hypothetical protein